MPKTVILIRAIFLISIITIFYLSLLPSFEIPIFASLSFAIDKVVHFFIFFYLSLLGLISKFRFSNRAVLISIFSLGLLIEVIHFYHPYRFFEVADLIANLLGIFLASFFIPLIKNSK